MLPVRHDSRLSVDPRGARSPFPVTLALLFVSLVFLVSLTSARLERTVLTTPMVFTAAGVVIGRIFGFDLLGASPRGTVLHLAEAGLVLLLFTDASRTDLGVLRSIRTLPARLLSTGMLLTLAFGAVAALALWPRFSVWEAGILSAILAPTDAGLGQSIVSSPRVSVSVRQALNVEAGLNDGLSVPFLLFFLAMLPTATPGHEAGLLQFIVEQLGIGVVIGAVLGGLGGYLLGLAERRHWMSKPMQALGVVALPLFCLLVSEPLGASMFIAAFTAGLFVQIRFPSAGRHSVEFAEGWGQMLNWFVFLCFGMFVARDWSQIDGRLAVYALLSLTVVRMLPVAIALRGTGLSRASVLFMGWFGPRGLASIVLALVYLEQEVHTRGEHTIQNAVLATVLLSIFAHGLTTQPGIRWYAARLAGLPPNAPEHSGETPPTAAGI